MQVAHREQLGIARAGSGLGRAVNEPVHNSLLSDYYDIPVRPRVYGVHRYANAAGQFIGPIVGGVMAYYWGWRSPFFVFFIVTFVFIVMGLRLREPIRGRWERKAMGASDEVSNTEEVAPSWAESYRIIWQVRSLRRISITAESADDLALAGLARHREGVLPAQVQLLAKPNEQLLCGVRAQQLIVVGLVGQGRD